MTKKERVLDGAELKNARLKKNWSQRLLAWKLGCDRSYVARMENGRKPLNNKALAFIEDVTAKENPCLGIHNEKSVKKVTNSINRINNLEKENDQKLCNLLNSRTLQDTEDAKAWEQAWFQYTHALCEKCKRACKQSAYVKIIECPQFEEGK